MTDGRVCARYPEPTKLIRNERKTLQFLMGNRLANEHYADLAAKARSAFDQTRVPLPNLDIEACCNVFPNGGAFKLFVGGRVRGTRKTYENVSYYLAVCRPDPGGSGKLELLRKFHFDHDPNAPRRPSLHLQYAGEATPLLSSRCISDKHLFPWLSEPRIPHAPMSLALLLHIAFTEFRDVNTEHFTEDSDWRGIVRDNEQLMLSWFYQDCGKHFERSTRGQSLLFERFCNA